MHGAGSALMGIGSARGDDRAVAAAEMAVSSPLLEASIDGARGVLLSVSGGSDLGLFEINEAARLVAEAAHPEANIIFGAVIDDALGDEVRVTVIAAGFDGGEPKPRTMPLRGAEKLPVTAAGRDAGRRPRPADARRTSAEREITLPADPARVRRPDRVRRHDGRRRPRRPRLPQVAAGDPDPSSPTGGAASARRRTTAATSATTSVTIRSPSRRTGARSPTTAGCRARRLDGPGARRPGRRRSTRRRAGPRAPCLRRPRDRGPGVALGVLVADCVPVLMSDESAGVVAAVHAGRRRHRADVVGRALEAMVDLGARADEVRGPARSCRVRRLLRGARGRCSDEVVSLVPGLHRSPGGEPRASTCARACGVALLDVVAHVDGRRPVCTVESAGPLLAPARRGVRGGRRGSYGSPRDATRAQRSSRPNLLRVRGHDRRVRARQPAGARERHAGRGHEDVAGRGRPPARRRSGSATSRRTGTRRPPRRPRRARGSTSAGTSSVSSRPTRRGPSRATPTWCSGRPTASGHGS